LAVVLGFLPARSGRILLSGRAAWCPQEAHLFDSTIRGNLMLGLPGARDGQQKGPAAGRGAGTPDVAESTGVAVEATRATAEARMREALAAVGLGPLLERLEDGLDTRIGPGGSFLSGGERQRLAVARTLMTGADVILLDEPTAHLDAESGRAMLAELRHGLRDRTVVLVTHNPQDIAPDDDRLDLDDVAKIAPVLAQAL
jgi:ATP-binding cassette subfamily C protein CydCD